MKVLICGGRDFRNETLLRTILDQRHGKHSFSRVIEGGTRGVDAMAKRWAWGHQIPVITFKADWARYGPGAGPIRNQQMLDEGQPELVIAFPGGKGTADMVDRARRAGVPVEEIPLTMQLNHERR